VDNGNVTHRPGYSAISGYYATISPHATQANDYSPLNTQIPCRNLILRKDIDSYLDFSQDIRVSSTLPPKTSDRLCSCMMPTLGCVANDEADEATKIQAADGICTPKSCPGTRLNGAEGIYDSYHMCNRTEKTSWVFNRQYLQSGNDSSACTSVSGILQNPKSPELLPNDCKILLRQAGPEGTGTVTLFPTATSDTNSEFAKSSSKLNSGAKVAIGVSIGIVAVLSIALLLCFRHRRRKSSNTQTSTDEPEGIVYQKAELPSDSIATENAAVMLLDSAQIVELEAPQLNELEDMEINEVEGLQRLELEAWEIPELEDSQVVSVPSKTTPSKS
jgi:hypothetical protein